MKQIPKGAQDFLIFCMMEQAGIEPSTATIWTVDENGKKEPYELDKPFQVGGITSDNGKMETRV